ASILMLPSIADLLSAKKHLSRKLLCRVSQDGGKRRPADRPKLPLKKNNQLNIIANWSIIEES
ncbi:MAG TPA: hypothetical protein PLK28_19770, partial [Candidatus Rifleibacterium sp.]|nr:hypothetical protein [Candidatus Rifleibacterium sp.]